MRDNSLMKAIAVTAEITGTELSAGAMKLMEQDLAAYPAESVLAALARCRRELTGRLSLAAITARIEDGYVGADEAWAIALPARDECATIIWTQEIASAYWDAASPLLAAGDKMGARMAFRDAYERLVRQARERGSRPSWIVTEGWDKDLRAEAVERAVTIGRLTQAQAQRYLPKPEPCGSVKRLLDGLLRENQ